MNVITLLINKLKDLIAICNCIKLELSGYDFERASLYVILINLNKIDTRIIILMECEIKNVAICITCYIMLCFHQFSFRGIV